MHIFAVGYNSVGFYLLQRKKQHLDDCQILPKFVSDGIELLGNIE